MIVELRSTGTQTVVGPSTHPDGDVYDALAGEPASVSAGVLAACVRALAEAVIEKRGHHISTDRHSTPSTPRLDFDDLHRRAVAYLSVMPPAVAGNGGHSQTYSAATALVHGFELDVSVALQILSEHYNVRCDPPWSEKELQHKIDQAATKPHDRLFGWLRDGQLNEPVDDVDLSQFRLGSKTPKAIELHSAKLPVELNRDPGQLPERLFDVPGFVRQVMDFTLANAPYPNVGLAFCGAMALQSFLAGRKVCTTGDLRTNLYLLALASSGTGKEFPRKVNSQVLFQIGMSASLGDKFASGEGIQDALIRTGRMLFQNDEMDGVLRQINLDQDNRRESIPNILLTLYTSASYVYPLRVKANQKEAIHIDQPHLTLFGTATPQYFYESLSKRMLTNGFFARLNIIDVGRRGPGQTPGSARDLPEAILKTAKWWVDFEPGTGNFLNFHPKPLVVQIALDAADAIDHLRRLTETEYDKAEEAGDEVARTAWSRTCEHAKKLSLIYACSENHENPTITLQAVEWATEFAMHQTHRQLYLAATYVAENPFHAECLKFVKKLTDHQDKTMQRRELMRAMKLKAVDFDQIVLTLREQGEIESIVIQTATKPAQGYRLLCDP